jgi:hypothetical protein
MTTPSRCGIKCETSLIFISHEPSYFSKMSLNTKTSAPTRAGCKQSVITPVAGLSAPLCKRHVASQAQTGRSIERNLSVSMIIHQASAIKTSANSMILWNLLCLGDRCLKEGHRYFQDFYSSSCRSRCWWR